MGYQFGRVIEEFKEQSIYETFQEAIERERGERMKDNQEVIYNLFLMHLWYSYYDENDFIEINDFNYNYILSMPIFKMLKDVMPEREYVWDFSKNRSMTWWYII